jgi:HAD superfamily hydrolase (TIGR01509 family)
MPIEAVIFDMDDLMINSHPVHMKVFEEILNQFGASLHSPKNPLSKEEEADFFGRTAQEILSFLRKKHGLENRVSVDEMNVRHSELLLPAFEQHAKPMPGLFELISSLKRQGYKLVLASSAKMAKIEVVLRKLDLKKAFEAIVSCEDEIKNGKPAPDIFLKAAEKIGVVPKRCLVLEDAKNGVEAAKAAGMRCIGVHNKFTFQILGARQDLSKADLQVNGLDEINPAYIKKL